MPETAVDKDSNAVLGQHEVGSAGKIVSMKPKTISKAVEKRSNEQFLPRILVLDTRHDLATFLFGKDVHLSRMWQKTTWREQSLLSRRRATEERHYQKTTLLCPAQDLTVLEGSQKLGYVLHDEDAGLRPPRLLAESRFSDRVECRQ